MLFSHAIEKRAHVCVYTHRHARFSLLCHSLLRAFPLTVNILQVVFDARFADCFFQDAIFNRLLFDLGKQVRDNTIEQLEVILEELGYIDIPDGPKADQLLQRIKDQ